MDRYKFRNRLILIIFLFSFLTSFVGINWINFLGPDEPRYAKIGFEMDRSGDYIVPKLHGKPWLEKPPLTYWFVAAGSKIFGESEVGARFFFSLLAFFFPPFLFLFLTKFLNNLKISFFSTLILIFSPYWFVFSKAISCDFLFSTFLFVSILLLYFYFEGVCKKYFLIFSSLFLALSVLSKGILAYILFFIFFYVYGFLNKKFFIFSRKFLITIFLSLLFSFPWFYLVFEKIGPYFFWEFIVNHNFARFFTPIHFHIKPFYYFFPVFFVGFFPFSLFIIHIKSLFQIDESMRKKIYPFLFTFIFYFIFFSLSKSKLPGYLFPAVLMLVIPFAYIWKEVERNSRSKSFFTFLFILFFLILDVLIVYLYKYTEFINILPYLILLVVSTLFSFILIKKFWKALLIKEITLLFVFFLFVLPFINSNFSTKNIVKDIPSNYLNKCHIYLYKTYEMTCSFYSGDRCIQNVCDVLFLKENLNSCNKIFIISKTKKLMYLLNSFTDRKMWVKIYGRYSLIKVWD